MMSDGLHWLRCAADRGNLDANFQLGIIYESVCVYMGVGVEYLGVVCIVVYINK